MVVTSSTLDAAPLGTAVVVRVVAGPQALVRRLAELGIRRAAIITPLHRTSGGGRVVDVAGSRIALADGVLRTIETESSA